VADDTLDTLGQRGQVGPTPTTGLDLNQPRLPPGLRLLPR
jgi:hypothetical protein